MFDVIVLTCDDYLSPKERNWYTDNILREDQLIMDALSGRGLKVGRKSWSDADFDWKHTKAALIRTAWDYFHRIAEWQQFLKIVSERTTLINPIELVKWNSDKHYLGQLRDLGVHIPETHFIEQGDKTTLKELHSLHCWEETILKPCVSGSARHTYRLNISSLDEHEATFQKLISEEAMMLQPFQKSILTEGEISLMVMGGKFTHAVIKKAKEGDFRVQDDFGGSVYPYEPSKEEMRFAETAVQACSPEPLYARVDIIRDNQGALSLIELELVEPELWFRLEPSAADTLAEAIVQTQGIF